MDAVAGGLDAQATAIYRYRERARTEPTWVGGTWRECQVIKKKGQSSITCLLKRMRPTTHARRRAALYRHNATLAAVKKKTEVCV